MKTRLARKIWNRQVDKLSPYWFNKIVKTDKLDSRFTQAIRKVAKWEANNLKNRIEKSISITPFQAKELRRSLESMTSFTDCINMGEQQIRDYHTKMIRNLAKDISLICNKYNIEIQHLKGKKLIKKRSRV